MLLHKKNAIALLITIVFVMLISVGLGIGLKYINTSSQTLKDENFIFQSVTLVDDFLNILKKSPDLLEVKDSASLAIFLSQAGLIPFESNDYSIVISITSARDKINPLVFKDKQRFEALRAFLLNYGVNADYSDMLYDLISGIKPDGTYRSDIFNENPYLFRNYIASQEHLEKLNEIYIKRYHDNSLQKINMKELFMFSSDTNTSIDLNYATPITLELLLACDALRAQDLNSMGLGGYSSDTPILLSDDENRSLSYFNVNYYQGLLAVKIEISKGVNKALIKFEYNIKLKKGYNFDWQV